MRRKWLMTAATTLAIAATIGACNSDSTNAPPDPDSSITLSNQTFGPVLRVWFKECGTANWGSDRLGAQEIINPDMDRVFPIEQGCWDLQSERLPTFEPGTPIFDTEFDVVVTPSAPFVWRIDGSPGGPV